MTALGAGIHAITAEAYHADPAERPSLSAGIAHLLCSRSPQHARHAHPKLNPDAASKNGSGLDIGTAAHALLLEGENRVRVVDAADWRTNDAKEQRDLAREHGQIPLLAHQWEHVQAMVSAVRAQIELLDLTPAALDGAGEAERTIVWEEPNGVLCRARPDWMHNSHLAIDDVKTTGGSADPEAWSRNLLWTHTAHMQAAFYPRGVKALTGTMPEFRLLVCEVDPPYALSVISLAPSALELAQDKVEWAIQEWARCLDTGEWPGYPSRLVHAELPPWEEARWLERAHHAEELVA